LLKKGNQIIDGKLTLEYSELEAPKGIHLKGLFNNLDLNSTFGNLVLKSVKDPAVIKGGKEFYLPVNAEHIITEGDSFLGSNLSQVLNQFHSGNVIPSSIHFRAKENYGALNAFAQHALTIANSKKKNLLYYTTLLSPTRRVGYYFECYSRHFGTNFIKIFQFI
jgi:hypothetical protein